MHFTAYFDESDTHGAEPHMVMGASLASAYQWEQFERRFRSLKREFGFNVLHAVELRTLTGEFQRWSEAKGWALVLRVGNILGNHVAETATVNLNHSIYRKHFLEVRPKKMHATSQYGVCFEFILRYFVGNVIGRGKKDQLSVVVEDGHGNASDTARIFADYKKRLAAEGHEILRAHSLASKAQCHPLMAMDMGVYGTARIERAIRKGTYTPRERQAPKEGDPGWLNHEIVAEDLSDLIEWFNKQRARAHADYLKRREAWLAAKSSEEQSP